MAWNGRRGIAMAIALMVSVGAGSAARAIVYFSDNFNSTGFQGSYIATTASDRFGDNTAYYSINNYNGWSFTGSTPYYALSQSGDGAVLLNETTGAASRTITGLTSGFTYRISLLMSGDNVQGNYSLIGTIDGSTIFNQAGTVLPSGTNPGTIVTALFTAHSSSVVLGLAQSTSGNSSPMFDNVQITSVPEASTWAMMIAGFGIVGVMFRHRRRRRSGAGRYLRHRAARLAGF